MLCFRFGAFDFGYVFVCFAVVFLGIGYASRYCGNYRLSECSVLILLRGSAVSGGM